MSDPSTAPTPSTGETKEKTFSKYTSTQGKAYSAARRKYHPSLYKALLDHHASTGGQFTTVLDIGCGPGLATRTLATHFDHAIGLDPSQGMIDTALSHAGTTRTSTPIQYFLSTGEQLGSNLSPPIPPSSIDLITAANAAHWISLPEFWLRAATLLKPSGSVAFWTSGEAHIHPSIPNHALIQSSMDSLRATYLGPYLVPGNIHAQEKYVNLTLPWHVSPPVTAFPESSFYRKDWGEDEEFYVGNMEVDLDLFEMMIGTGSPVTRWREANPELVGTEGDVVRVMRREIERLLREGGVREGEERVKGTNGGALLVFKRA